jgi:hypothetical protein
MSKYSKNPLGRVKWHEWTNEPPRVPGYYWAFTRSGCMPVEVGQNHNGLVHVYAGGTSISLDRALEEDWLWWTNRIKRPPRPRSTLINYTKDDDNED